MPQEPNLNRYYTPSVIIENISNKVVDIVGLYRLKPGERVDLYIALDPTTDIEDAVLRGLIKPYGDLYREAVLKQTIRFHRILLPSFYYSIVIPDNIVASNDPQLGYVPSYSSGEGFTWVDPAGIANVLPPLLLSGGFISIPKASATTDGYLSKEDWLRFNASVKPSQKIWQYQDFVAPVSASLTLTAFQNGTGLAFNSSYIVDSTAQIVLTADTSRPPTTTTSIPAKFLPGNRVSVDSHIGTTVILNQTPHSSLNCRVFYLISLPATIALPTDYQEDPEFLNDASNDYLDENYVNQNQDESIYGIKTFENNVILNGGFKFTTGATDGYVLTSDAVGNGSWQSVSAVSGISSIQHENLDTLVHNLSENYFEEFIYTGSIITGNIVWTNSSKITKIRESIFTYSGSNVVQEVSIQYNGSGVEVQRLTVDYTYSGSTIVSAMAVEAP